MFGLFDPTQDPLSATSQQLLGSIREVPGDAVLKDRVDLGGVHRLEFGRSPHFPCHSVRLLDPCDTGVRPSATEPRERDACTNACVGGATLTQSTRAPWSADLASA